MVTIESPEIQDVTGQIVQLCDPVKIYLYNQRTGLRGNTTSFKLCVIVRSGDRLELEQAIYMQIDCDVPFDVVVYTLEQWEIFTKDCASFANKIEQTGVVLHG